MEDLQKQLENALPPFVTRRDLATYLGGLLSPSYMANLDSRGKGPKGSHKIGKKVIYERTHLIQWLLDREKH